MKELSYVWYSAKQDAADQRRLRREGLPIHRVFAKLEDDSEVLYTELKSNDSPSDFDDAIYLGRGHHSRIGARIG